MGEGGGANFNDSKKARSSSLIFTPCRGNKLTFIFISPLPERNRKGVKTYFAFFFLLASWLLHTCYNLYFRIICTLLYRKQWDKRSLSYCVGTQVCWQIRKSVIFEATGQWAYFLLVTMPGAGVTEMLGFFWETYTRFKKSLERCFYRAEGCAERRRTFERCIVEYIWRGICRASFNRRMDTYTLCLDLLNQVAVSLQCSNSSCWLSRYC